ncbi:MAG: PBSX family phage terminase large subunit [Clostridia bacterium]|nr:PBSX family phage terminase large subunit [Clostridia bacterium]
MSFKAFSEKQLDALSWWSPKRKTSSYDGIICDGAVRSGKTLCMSVSFISWAMFSFDGGSFAICGKTIRSVKRNVASPLLNILRELGFRVQEKLSSNIFIVYSGERKNTFYLFGGRDESSAALIQGITLCGVLFDEAALMPRSFVEQALARCSVEGSKLWFNCNPEYPQHWFCREWVKKTKEKNIYYLHFVMEDNPSLSKKMLERYKKLYSGSFYDRFVLGKWTASEGLVYPFMSDDKMLFDIPDGYAEQYVISCDYGTVNPSSFGLWGLFDGCWYRIGEYYYSSKKEGMSRTDEEHYTGLCELAGDRDISKIVVDPSAASFIEVIRRHGKYKVVSAKNNVLDGIRQTSTALKEGSIRICRSCGDSIREFGLYRWESGGNDRPVKENDHSMDDIRYFVSTVLNDSDGGFFVFAAQR